MLRAQTDTGWWLITHQEHARLAAEFASHWGNSMFVPPHPRREVLEAIRVHDDGWAARDAHPGITRQGRPAAFSEELVGKYSAFEEIDLADYLSVRGAALDEIEARSAYAALLVSMHTYNLLTERADRSTIAPDRLPLLDTFLAGQLERQRVLRARVHSDANFSSQEVSEQTIIDNFHLLQATDNLSLLSCVSYRQPATLLHSLPVVGGRLHPIGVYPSGPGTFRLHPYPLDEERLTFELQARQVEGHLFLTAGGLDARFTSAPLQCLTVTITA
jgi:hypothetical protein